MKLKDGPNNPHLHANAHFNEAPGLLRIRRRELWTNPPVRRICQEQKFGQPQAGPGARKRAGVKLKDGPNTNLSGTNLDSRRLAPEREARRGEAHGWAEQSPPPR
ncbi:hypothetical protein GCM10027021_35370 [Dyella kyungheensis]